MTGATEKFPKNKWYRQLAGEVSPRAFVIGFVLVENFLFKGQTECWSSQETLARLANASPRTVRDGLRELEDRGFLKHRRGGKGHANRYVPVLFDRQNFAGQNGLDTAFDRQDSAYDDRQDSAADITVQQLKGGAAHAGPATAALWSTVVENVATTSAAPDAGLLPAGRQVFDSSIEPDDEPKSLADLLDELTSLLDDISDAGITIPEELQAFLDRDVDPEDDDAVSHLLAMAEELFDAHREAQLQSERVEPLSVRFGDPARRASYADRVVSYLCSLPKEQRAAVGWRYHRQIVNGLKETLPRYLAERLAGELRDEIFTEVWRRTRAAAPTGNVVSLDAHRRDRNVA